MSILSKIKNAIFGKDDATGEGQANGPHTINIGTAETPKSGSIAGTVADAGTTSAPVATPTSEQAATTPKVPAGSSTSSSTPSTSAVDVGALLDAKVKTSGQTLNWRTSIVDLMKALGMEASLSERKELADELGYTGDKGDSATMNMWLHKALLKKLAENGGNVPPDLLD